MAQTSTSTTPARHEQHASDPARDIAEQQKMRDEAEAKTATLPLPGTQVVGRISGEQYAEANGEKTAKMHFPNALTLTTDKIEMVTFGEGVQEVPESLKDHPYLKASGVRAL
jgi:hypothetical protein